MTTASTTPPTLTSGLLTQAALFDMSHFGRLIMSGSDAVDLMNRLSTNDLEKLEPGLGMSTVLTTNKGRVIDLLHVLHQEEDLLILTSPGTQRKVAEWIEFYTFIEDVAVTDISAATSERIYIGEPAVQSLIESRYLTDTLAANLTHTQDGETTVARYDIGELPAYRIIASKDHKLPDFGLKELDADEFNTLRIEQAIAAYPAEMNEDHNPLEANLKPYISFNKGCYIGQEVVARLNTYDRVQRFMCRLELDPARIIAPGSPIIVDGKAVGEVTSSTQGVALAFLRKRFYQDGREVTLQLDDKLIPAIVRDIRPPEYND